MFKMRIVRPQYRPEVGLFFTYGGQQFKVIRIHAMTGNLYFAWWDGKLGKVLTTDMEDPGMTQESFSMAIHTGKYEVINKRIVHPSDLREFSLF